MALDTITPSNREEEYLSAIAGDEGASAPVPSNRREEWLRRIAEGQSDQTERLDQIEEQLEHIEDQVPIDPTVDDVGKVMTVVEDTSGEEPVYKWSAEEVRSAGKGVAHLNIGSQLVYSTNSLLSLQKSDQKIAEAWPGIAAELRAALGTYDFFAILDRHVKVYSDGVRLIPKTGTPPAAGATTVSLTAYRPVITTAGGFWARYSATVNFADNTTGNAVVVGYALYEADGVTALTNASTIGSSANASANITIIA